MNTLDQQSGQLVTEEQLKAWTKYSRTADLMEWLRSNGIAYFRGRGGSVMTTVQAVNAPLKNEKNSSFEWY